MADATNPTGEGQGTGTTPTPPANNQGGEGTAPKVSDQDVINHPIYKGVYNDMKDLRDKVKSFEDAKKAEDEKRMKDQGEFQKLADQEKARADEFKTKYEQSQKFNAFVTAAAKAGITLLDDAWKLADTSKLALDESGSVTGIDDVVKDLVSNRPFLVGKQSAPKVGEPTTPPNGQGGNGSGEKPTFKRSQLRDTKFFNENREAIMLAAKEGRVIDDVDAPAAS